MLEKYRYLDFWTLYGRNLGYLDSFDNFEKGQKKKSAITPRILTFRGRDLSESKEENLLRLTLELFGARGRAECT